MSPSPSKRWCPTPEQLMILEELYKRGVRTPNASQIQKITAHLAFYGKIQGKNVFYWFQNHKARDRQKLRKKLKQLHQQQFLQQQLYTYNIQQERQCNNVEYHPSMAFHQFSNAAERMQQARVGDAQEGMMNYSWRPEFPNDCLSRTYGHDSMMIMNEGPTFSCCRNRPLETLELFPVRSTSVDQDP